MDYGDPDPHAYSSRKGNSSSNSHSNGVPRPTFSGTIRSNSLEEPTRFPPASHVPMPAAYPYMANANGYPSQLAMGSYGNYQTPGYMRYPYQQYPPPPPQLQSQQVLPQYPSGFPPPTTYGWNYPNNTIEGGDSRGVSNNLPQTRFATKRLAPVSYEDISTPAPSLKRKRRKKNKNRRSQKSINRQQPSDDITEVESTPVVAKKDTSAKRELEGDKSDVTTLPQKKEDVEAGVGEGGVAVGNERDGNDDGYGSTDAGSSDNDDDDDDDDDDEYLIKQSESLASLKDRKEPIPVPGTSITLGTEEDIAKWREERRKMWLLKISNNRKVHMENLGVTEEELNKTSILRESKKQKQFIQNIQNQVNRFDPRANLHLRIVQRGLSEENKKLLDFIEELGDAGLLEYELTQEERGKLFGNKPLDRGKRQIQRGPPPNGQLYKSRTRPTEKDGASRGKETERVRDTEDLKGDKRDGTQNSIPAS